MQKAIIIMQGRIKKPQFIIGIFLGAMIVLVFTIGFVTLADIASDFCPGNVCASQEITFKADTSSDKCGGPNTLQYFYTQHARPGEKFKVRFSSKNPMNTDCALLFAVTDFENFDKTIGKYGHYDSAGPSSFGTETTTPFTFKVESDKGFKGSLDFVMWLTIPQTTPSGVYTFKIGATEYNQNYTSGTLKLYVDSIAPSNDNEEDEFSGVNDWLPCADNVDNDLSYRRDCADSNCLGKIGKKDCVVTDQCKCEASETTCLDRFDNDFDIDGNAGGATNSAGGDYESETGADCRDLDCDTLQGDVSDSSKKCYFKNEFGGFPSSCEDYFNNDADQGAAESANVFANLAEAYLGKNNTWRDCLDDDCWRKGGPCPAKETICDNGIDDDFDNGLNTKDEWPLTGADCAEYDCVGNSNCPAQENLDKDEKSALGQCFDGLDNDLDAYEWVKDKYVAKDPLTIDCGDPDCKKVQNPESPFNVCSDYEFVIGSYQYCANPIGYLAILTGGIDDDGDQAPNCQDKKGNGPGGTDCWQRFGNCGPCPSTEFWKYDACADSLNNDFDNTTDCKDTDCANKIGRLSGIAYCQSENTDTLCSDNFDNDGDDQIDCADKNCDGEANCEFETESKCSDGFDNDADAKIDCDDTDCQGKGSCITPVDCLTGDVPLWSAWKTFATQGTIQARQYEKLHDTDKHKIQIKGTGQYSSLTVTIGNAVKSDNYFPYNSTQCEALIDTGTGQITTQMIVTTDKVGNILQIINKPKVQLTNFDVTLTCALTNYQLGEKKVYPIAVDALKIVSGNEDSESGEQMFETVVLEKDAPSVLDVEVVDAKNGVVNVPYGGSLLVRAKTGQDQSGICGCKFKISQQADEQFAKTCQLTVANQTQDINNYYLQASAEDGSGNSSGYNPVPAEVFKLNVTPVAVSAPKLNKTSPFYTDSETISFDGAKFQGAQNSTFEACKIIVDDKDIGPATIGNGGTASCNGNFVANFASGEHLLSLKATDNDGDSIQSPIVVFYVCNPGDTKSPCDKADFDQDGVPERTYTTMYGAGDPDKGGLACDNCVGLNNPDQEDADGDGIGDDCETKKHCKDKGNKLIICENSKIPEECTGCCVIGKCVKQNDETKGSKQLCCPDTDTSSECPSGEKCKIEVNPWLETKWSDIYAGKSVNLTYPPPDKFNVTFCILTSGEMAKFSSEKCETWPLLEIGALELSQKPQKPEKPDVVNLYSKNILSSINLKKLRPKATTLTSANNIPSQLNSQIYLITGDAEISNEIIFSNNSGAGTIIIEGNLIIKNNLAYDASLPDKDKVDTLASPGFIVLGNITIDPAVTNLVGVYFAGGTISTGISNDSLILQGIVAAHKFNFQRQTKSLDFGSEQIIYDGRAAANPPPGMGDFVKTLPAFKEVVP